MTIKKCILTGDRPTGKLHQGQYVGSIENRVKLDEKDESYFSIADLHTLPSRPDMEGIGEVRQNIRAKEMDDQACGIDPNKSMIFMQSQVRSFFEMITSAQIPEGSEGIARFEEGF